MNNNYVIAIGVVAATALIIIAVVVSYQFAQQQHDREVVKKVITNPQFQDRLQKFNDKLKQFESQYPGVMP